MSQNTPPFPSVLDTIVHFPLTPTLNDCWPPYPCPLKPHTFPLSARWPRLQQIIVCLYLPGLGLCASLLKVPTWSPWAPTNFSLWLHVRSQSPLQIRLVQWEVVYTHSMYTRERAKSIIPSIIRLSHTWQIFSPDCSSSLNFICVFLIFLKFNFCSFFIYFKLRTLHHRYMDGK